MFTIAIFGGNIPSAALIVLGGIVLAAWLTWSIRTYSKSQGVPPRLREAPAEDFGVAPTRKGCESFTELLRLADEFRHQNPDLLSYDPPDWNWPENTGR